MSVQAREKREFEAKLHAFVGLETAPAYAGKDLVNEPMIRHWCAAMGDENPIYTDPEIAQTSVHGGIVAPPTMLQSWIMPGIEMADPSKLELDKQRELHALLTDHGYPSVVATNCEQGYTRYLRPGDQVWVTTTIESISEEKATGLGIGYFINTRDIYRDQNGEELGWLTFRVLKFKPSQQPQAAASEAGASAAPRRLRPPLGHDNAWWWEGIDRGELLIQKCSDCGELRHPPRPMCGKCQSTEWETQISLGRGSVYSYTIVHHPQIPGYDTPFAAATIELEEGTRLISNVVGCDPGAVHIGLPVQLSIENVDEEFKLPLFRPAGSLQP